MLSLQAAIQPVIEQWCYCFQIRPESGTTKCIFCEISGSRSLSEVVTVVSGLVGELL